MSKEEMLQQWRDVLQALQPRQVQRKAQVGDGGGSVEVSGRPGWVWVRFQEEQNRLAMVRSFLGYLANDTPVIIGKRHPEDTYEQVLYVDWGTYSLNLTDYILALTQVPPHGESHHGTYGSDPAWIDYANLVMGRVAPTDPASMAVHVEPFVYGYGSSTQDFDGYALDLTSEVPGGAGHLYVLVYFDPDSASIGYELSDTVPLAVNPTVPALTDPNAIPLAVVRLYNGQTEITIDDTWQRKLLLGTTGGDPLTPLQLAVVHEGDVLTHNGEIVWAT